jgi:hypothetical protein
LHPQNQFLQAGNQAKLLLPTQVSTSKAEKILMQGKRFLDHLVLGFRSKDATIIKFNIKILIYFNLSIIEH